MKIRTDYVSNSSSSSFVLCGKTFNPDEAIKQLLSTNKEMLEQYENGEIGWWDIYDEIEANCRSLTIETAGYDDDVDELAIGLSPSKMKDSQTLAEFKKQCADEIEAVGLKCSASDVRFISGGSDAGGCSFIGSCG